MYKVGICGHFGFGKSLLNGQTIKTKIISDELDKLLGKSNVLKVDTHGGIKKMPLIVRYLVSMLRCCENIIILPAHNGLKVIVPILASLNRFYNRDLHYIVIGGWLPEFLDRNKYLIKYLNKFSSIAVETAKMKERLYGMGFKNVYIFSNCKSLKIVGQDELIYKEGAVCRLCTFSRVMKEKGIEDAINSVIEANKQIGDCVYTLDIYGQIDSAYKERFETLKSELPSYIRYKGCIPFDKSTDVIKAYQALLFPTYYEGEGFAGTIIDAYAAGVPVIATDWRYNKEIVKNRVTGILYDYKKSKQLTEILMEQYSNYTLDDMKIKCIEEAQNYLAQKVVKEYIQTFVSDF